MVLADVVLYPAKLASTASAGSVSEPQHNELTRTAVSAAITQ